MVQPRNIPTPKSGLSTTGPPGQGEQPPSRYHNRRSESLLNGQYCSQLLVKWRFSDGSAASLRNQDRALIEAVWSHVAFRSDHGKQEVISSLPVCRYPRSEPLGRDAGGRAELSGGGFDSSGSDPKEQSWETVLVEIESTHVDRASVRSSRKTFQYVRGSPFIPWASYRKRDFTGISIIVP